MFNNLKNINKLENIRKGIVMATWKQLSAAFLLSLTLIGVSIYYFIEDKGTSLDEIVKRNL